MDRKTQTQTSKFLSLVLRHQPDAIGIVLDDAGWVSVDRLLQAATKHPRGKLLNRTLLDEVVASNSKQRFEFDAERSRIRARQGHSVDVDLGYQPTEPPESLFHGTPIRTVELIRQSGLLKMQRHHVHLHTDKNVAETVGARRGQSVVLVVQAGVMHAEGQRFFVTDNNVWLTDHVPAAYIEFPKPNEC